MQYTDEQIAQQLEKLYQTITQGITQANSVLNQAQHIEANCTEKEVVYQQIQSKIVDLNGHIETMSSTVEQWHNFINDKIQNISQLSAEFQLSISSSQSSLETLRSQIQQAVELRQELIELESKIGFNKIQPEFQDIHQQLTQIYSEIEQQQKLWKVMEERFQKQKQTQDTLRMWFIALTFVAIGSLAGSLFTLVSVR